MTYVAGRPSTSGDEKAWEAVARAVKDRRRNLNLVGRDIEDHGVSRTVLSLIENERQDRYETRKLRQLSLALKWTPDSIERILEGKSPIPTDDEVALLLGVLDDVAGDWGALGEYIRAVRDEHDLSVEEMAGIAEIPAAAWDSLEHGVRPNDAPRDTLRRVAKALEISVRNLDWALQGNRRNESDPSPEDIDAHLRATSPAYRVRAERADRERSSEVHGLNGSKYSRLTPAQQKMIDDLIDEFLGD